MQNNVSIVIPCYNLGRFLPETIASIEVARTPRLREVIIVDDGSTDLKTIEILDDLGKSGYCLLRQSNQGVSAARNNGIRHATGKYILPVDSDNRIRKTYLSEAVQILDDDPSIGVVYGDAEYFGGKTGRWSIEEFNFARLVLINYIDACALFRKSLWEDLGGYDEQMPFFGWEDWDFWLRASLREWRFVHLAEIAFDYRVREGSLLSQANQRADVIENYMFSKTELAALGKIRAELNRLRNIEQSMEYRLGKRLLSPVRKAQSAFGINRVQLEAEARVT